MAYIQRVKLNKNRYWQVRHTYRIDGDPSSRYIAHLGPVDTEHRGECPECGEEAIIYPGYGLCGDCTTDLPEIKEKVEKKRKYYKGR